MDVIYCIAKDQNIEENCDLTVEDDEIEDDHSQEEGDDETEEDN